MKQLSLFLTVILLGLLAISCHHNEGIVIHSSPIDLLENEEMYWLVGGWTTGQSNSRYITITIKDDPREFVREEIGHQRGHRGDDTLPYPTNCDYRLVSNDFFIEDITYTESEVSTYNINAKISKVILLNDSIHSLHCKEFLKRRKTSSKKIVPHLTSMVVNRTR
ncbi:MAG: hypothetical protein ISR65_19350 [Bacteriovoracaceae bacterium]|nr:hypothetical protein [Bacteriovoracaceae bacterium]